MPNATPDLTLILSEALKLADPIARADYLDRVCGEDVELRQQVEALLVAQTSEWQASVSSTPSDTTQIYLPDGGDASEQPTLTREPMQSIGDVQTVTVDRSGRSTPAGQSPAPSIGMLIAGRYRLVEVIGEGGMGSVYLAEQSEPVKRKVALKLIKSGTDSRKVLARFEAERQALALMDHPSIARVYDGGTTAAGQPYFVMELVQGVPITQFCDKNCLSPQQRLELFVQVCRAVQHAHQKGIIHRDLKPGNILVTEVDGRPTPKVIDFGVAKATEFKLADMSFSENGAIVGTPAYMSPEQADPSVADIDTRTDVFALGVVLYELLAGETPISPKDFRRGAVLEMLRMVREQEPEHLSTKASSADGLPNIAANRGLEPSQLLSFLRGDVDWIVLKALEKDRERRYESANGMAADILRYLANEPVAARPPSRAYRFRKFVRRNRGAVFASSLIAFALLLGVLGIIWQWREAVYQRRQADIARADAENNYRIAQEQRKVALQAVGQMVTTVRTELLKKPDLQGVLKKVLEIAQASLDNIAQNPLVDISLNDTTRAAAHDATARMYRDLGESAKAKEEFRKAIDIYQAILDKAVDGPDKDVVKDNLVLSLLGLGYETRLTSGQAEVRDLYDRAARLVENLGPKAPTSRKRSLAFVYGSLGSSTIDRSPRDAKELYLKALRITESIADDESITGKISNDIQTTLVQNQLLVGGAAGRLRDSKSCEDYYRKALITAKALVADKPDDIDRNRLEALVHARLGDLLLRTNRPADSAKEIAMALLHYKIIADSDRRNVVAQEDYARNLYCLGLAAERAGNKPAAADNFQSSLKIRQARANWRSQLDACRNMMMSLAHTGSHKEAIELAESVRTQLPKDHDALVDIANCYAVCSATGGLEKDSRDRYAIKALDTLKQALDAGYGDKVNLETEPDLDAIRDRPEFKAMLSKMPEP